MLITIADLEAATGLTISSEDEAMYQWYIDAVSGYIIDYTDEDFAVHTNEVLVCQADGWGIIEFPQLDSVSKVEHYDQWQGLYEEITFGNYRFDGISKVLYLLPHETYKITCSYGYTSVPASIKSLATQLVMAGSGLDRSAVGGIKNYRIGDKEIQYGVTANEAGGPIITLAAFQRRTLDKYGFQTRTLRL